VSKVPAGLKHPVWSEVKWTFSFFFDHPRSCQQVEEAVPEDIRWLFQTPLEECLHWSLFRQRAWINNWESIIKKEQATQIVTGQMVAGDHKLIPIVNSNHAF